MKITAQIFIFSVLVSHATFAAIYDIGESRDYISPNELYTANVVADGDTIFIDAEDYVGNNALAVWSQNNLFIQGTGGRPHLIADGAAIWGKGIWVFAGNDISVDNIEFSGATVPDKNGAGIRLDGIGLTATNCYFHNNENGILTNNSYEGVITIEHCEFGGNGFSDGYSHNLYIGHVQKLVFQFNYSHHAKIGHCLKSRAAENIIQYNRIMDETTGSSSRLIDIPNGGYTILMGNIIMQGPNAENVNSIGYGLEGLEANEIHKMLFINNTLISKRGVNATFFQIQDGTEEVYIANNIFGGEGSVNAPSFAKLENNIIEQDIESLLLIDEVNFDYNLNSNSPSVDAGKSIDPIDGNELTPLFSYLHNIDNIQRPESGSSIDIGAYEFEFVTSAIDESLRNDIIVFPNPAKLEFRISGIDLDFVTISLLDCAGNKIRDINPTEPIDIADLKAGVYYVKQTKKGVTNSSKLLIVD
ncbi:MAG: hypothetical protein ACJA1A_003862 [Saprospiraceae bacterium]|jgi:hypothetical protein